MIRILVCAQAYRIDCQGASASLLEFLLLKEEWALAVHFRLAFAQQPVAAGSIRIISGLWPVDAMSQGCSVVSHVLVEMGR